MAEEDEMAKYWAERAKQWRTVTATATAAAPPPSLSSLGSLPLSHAPLPAPILATSPYVAYPSPFVDYSLQTPYPSIPQSDLFYPPHSYQEGTPMGLPDGLKPSSNLSKNKVFPLCSNERIKWFVTERPKLAERCRRKEETKKQNEGRGRVGFDILHIFHQGTFSWLTLGSSCSGRSIFPHHIRTRLRLSDNEWCSRWFLLLPNGLLTSSRQYFRSKKLAHCFSLKSRTKSFSMLLVKPLQKVKRRRAWGNGRAILRDAILRKTFFSLANTARLFPHEKKQKHEKKKKRKESLIVQTVEFEDESAKEPQDPATLCGALIVHLVAVWRNELLSDLLGYGSGDDDEAQVGVTKSVLSTFFLLLLFCWCFIDRQDQEKEEDVGNNKSSRKRERREEKSPGSPDFPPKRRRELE